jgi:phosphate starvation-inducible PhoH-like protein
MGNNIVANGFAGTGKSIMGLYLALTDVLREDSPQKYIKIIRSAVPSREIGHLPGDIEEKISVYEQPYRDIINWLCKDRESTYDNMKDAGLVDFKVTSFVRGLTWNDSVIIVDEAQNMTMQEIHSIMTRIGDNTKIFVCGDFTQNDLLVKKSDTSGYREFLQIAKKMSCFDVIEYQKEDIVRSAFVREWILAKED